MNKIKLAIFGASGLVGRKMVEVLEEVNIDIENLYLYASSKSKGLSLSYRGKDFFIDELNDETLKKDFNYALFATPHSISGKYIPTLIERKVKVIDNSSYFRKTHPLIVAGVNDHLITDSTYLIANPNCGCIQSMIALDSVHKLFSIKRIIYSTYQATSGSGIKGILDLKMQTKNYYEKGITNNLIPVISYLNEDGYSGEEEKLIFESKKILNNYSIDVNATCVRVSVENAHSINIVVECEKEADLESLIHEYQKNKYIKFYKTDYPTPKEVDGSDLVHISRLRYAFNDKKWLSMFVIADNLRVGAATNAIRILEKLVKGEVK